MRQSVATPKEIFGYGVLRLVGTQASRDRSVWVSRLQEHKVQQDFVIAVQSLIRAQGRACVFKALKCVHARSSRMTAAKIMQTYLYLLGTSFP